MQWRHNNSGIFSKVHRIFSVPILFNDDKICAQLVLKHVDQLSLFIIFRWRHHQIDSLIKYYYRSTFIETGLLTLNVKRVRIMLKAETSFKLKDNLGWYNNINCGYGEQPHHVILVPNSRKNNPCANLQIEYYYFSNLPY